METKKKFNYLEGNILGIKYRLTGQMEEDRTKYEEGDRPESFNGICISIGCCSLIILGMAVESACQLSYQHVGFVGSLR